MASLFRPFLLAALVLLGALWVVRAGVDEVGSLVSGFHAVSCPAIVRFNDRPVADARGEWMVAVSDTHKTAPRVDVRQRGGDCLLAIKSVPGMPLDGIDWRIGFTLKDSRLAQAKRARFSVSLQADRPISFSAASFYSYDGKTVTGVPVSELNQKAQGFVVEREIPPGTASLEMWLRLTIHGTISTTGDVIAAPFVMELFE